MKSLATIPQTLGLAEMSADQLAGTFTKLDAARQHYDNLSGICATLQGLVLIEAKEKVGHGKYGQWLKDHFPKSADTAGRFFRIAEDFLVRSGTKNTPESKFRTGAEFGEQLLLSDLANSLQAIQHESLDMGHPIVKSIAAYAAGRSYKQMWLDLGPAPAGGDRSASRQIRDLDEEIEFQKLKAQDQFQNLVVNMEEFFLSKRGNRFELLGDADRQIILGLLIDINKANRK